MKSFLNDTSKYISPDPPISITNGTSVIMDLAANNISMAKDVTVASTPRKTTTLQSVPTLKSNSTSSYRNNDNNDNNGNGNFDLLNASQSQMDEIPIEEEFERLSKIDLSYLTLFRKSSKFSSIGFNHFFLSQELKCDDTFTNINGFNNHKNGQTVNNSEHVLPGMDKKLNNNTPSITSDETNSLSSDLQRNKSVMTMNTVKSNGTNNTISSEAHAIYNLSFSLDGKYLASAGADGLIRVWGLITSEMDRREHFNKYDHLNHSNIHSAAKQTFRKSFIDTAFDDTINGITSILNVPEMKASVSRSRRNTLISNESDASSNISYGLDHENESSSAKDNVYAPVFKTKPVKIFYHDKTINSLDWSKNNFLISSSDDGTVKLWHVDRADCLQTYKFDCVVTCAQFHKLDDRFFVASQWNGRLVLLSILEKEIIFEINLSKSITCIEFSPESDKIFVGCDAGYIFSVILDKKGFKIECDYQLKKKKSAHRITGIKCYYDNSKSPKSFLSSTPAYKHRTDTAAKSETIKMLITSNDSKCRLINYTGRFLEVRYSGFINKYSSISSSLNEDHTHLISGSEDGWTYIWQIYSDKKNKIDNEKKMLNKAHFDILNLLKDDKSIIDNKYYGSFHSNNNRCNVSIFAPRAASKLLELSNDPLFDLKHKYSYALQEAHVKDSEVDDLTTAIIVTADNSGKIKVFRRDFAHYVRKNLQNKKVQQIIENKLKKTVNNNSNKKVLNRNTLVIPDYEATPMNIRDTMTSVYSDINSRGRGDSGIVKPANKFAVESVNENRGEESDYFNGDHKFNSAQPTRPQVVPQIIIDNIHTDANRSSGISASGSVQNIDDELKQLILETPDIGMVHSVEQKQHSRFSSPMGKNL